MDPSEAALQADVDRLCQSAAFRDVVWRHHRYRRASSDRRALCMDIHPGDQMLRHSLRTWREANRSVSQYFSVALQQHDAAQQILHLTFDGQPADLAILDFACGYGRLLRFLIHSCPAERIWASDIQRDAVDYVVGTFGVNGLYSSPDPEAFQAERKFDFIWVASLFSHLPAELFRAWLLKLRSLLTPRGVLAFSVHDQRLLSADLTMPEQGIHYLSTSEIEELDNRSYGTSFVAETFVRRVIEVTGGGGMTARRLERGLANEQDIYVVAADPARDLGVLDAFRKGTWGCVDVMRFPDDKHLDVIGWAASLDEGPAESVEITVDGKRYRCPTTVNRDDVRRVLGDERLHRVGWEFVGCPVDRDEVFLEVSAQSSRDELGLLYAGTIRRS